jgi:hypothetical protein
MTVTGITIIIVVATRQVRRFIGGLVGLGLGAAIASGGGYYAPPPVYYGCPATTLRAGTNARLLRLQRLLRLLRTLAGAKSVIRALKVASTPLTSKT